MTDFPDDLASAFVDDELDAEQRAAFEREVGVNPSLRAEVDAVAEVRTLVRSLDPPAIPDGMLESLLNAPDAPEAPDALENNVRDLDAHRARRTTAVIAAAAAAAAVLLAVVVPGASRAQPTLATDVRQHQAGAAANGDPVSGLAPLATPLGLGR